MQSVSRHFLADAPWDTSTSCIPAIHTPMRLEFQLVCATSSDSARRPTERRVSLYTCCAACGTDLDSDEAACRGLRRGATGRCVTDARDAPAGNGRGQPNCLGGPGNGLGATTPLSGRCAEGPPRRRRRSRRRAPVFFRLGKGHAILRPPGHAASMCISCGTVPRGPRYRHPLSAQRGARPC